MTIRHSRLPGPIGLKWATSAPAGRGPLGLVPAVFPAPKSAVQKKQKKKPAVKKLAMPQAAGDNKTKLARDITWDLFQGGGPSEKDVQQGALRNCPLASLLTALAYTATGDKHIAGMIHEKKESVQVDLSGVMGDLDESQPGKTIASNRYFTVKLAGTSYAVSAVLYTDDADSNWSLIYMRSPTEALWPCLIEKAYAKHLGGYGDLDSLYGQGKTLNEVWADVVGSKPSGFEVTANSPADSVIRSTAKAARRVPTVAASKMKLVMSSGATRWHGFLVMGMQGKKIQLYDSMKLRQTTMTMKEFRADFGAVLYGSL